MSVVLKVYQYSPTEIMSFDGSVGDAVDVLNMIKERYPAEERAKYSAVLDPEAGMSIWQKRIRHTISEGEGVNGETEEVNEEWLKPGNYMALSLYTPTRVGPRVLKSYRVVDTHRTVG